MYKVRLCSVLAAGILLSNGASNAADLSIDFHSQPVSEELATFIGQNTISSTLTADETGTVAVLAQEFCKTPIPDSYFTAIKFANPTLFERSSSSKNISDAAVEKGAILQLPKCFPTPVIVPRLRAIRDDDKLWKFYQESGIEKALVENGLQPTFGPIDENTLSLGVPIIDVSNNPWVLTTDGSEYSSNTAIQPIIRPIATFDTNGTSPDISIIQLASSEGFGRFHDPAVLGASQFAYHVTNGVSPNNALSMAWGDISSGDPTIPNPAGPGSNLVNQDDFNKNVTLVADYYRNAPSQTFAIQAAADALTTNRKAIVPSDRNRNYANWFKAFNPQRADRPVNDLRPGEIVFEPVIAQRTVTFPLKSDAQETTASIATTGTTLAALDTSESSNPQLIPTAIGVTEANDNQCTGNPYRPSHAEIDTFTLRLIENQLLMQEMKREPRAVVIRVPDTGFLHAPSYKNNPFQLSHFVSEGDLADNKPVNSKNGRVAATHGTTVGALALGGPALINRASILGYDVKIEPRAIYRIGSPIQRIEGYKLAKVIESPLIVLSDQLGRALDDTDIVNLSIGGTRPIAKLERHLNENSVTLFVSAAGNNFAGDANSGVSLNEKALYPARYGGAGQKGAHNMITVAALNADNKTLSNFSNYGTNYVHIAAPGCNVESWGYSKDAYVPTNVNGTSFAAPLVSHVAALLYSTLRPFEMARPSQLKARILASSDLNEALAFDKVEDGRILNINKAIAVFTDVLDFTDVSGKTKTVYGEIDKRKLIDFCPTSLSDQAKLIKIARHPEKVRRDAGLLRYYAIERGVFSMADCMARQDASVTLTQEKTERSFKVDLGNITDIVFRSIDVK